MQGVSYRASTVEQARRLGVRGWVRNLPSGEVEAVAEAAPEVIDTFVAWCMRGPTAAEVEGVAVTDVPADAPLTNFEVRR